MSVYMSPSSSKRVVIYFLLCTPLLITVHAFMQSNPAASSFYRDQIQSWQNKYNERSITSIIDFSTNGRISLFLNDINPDEESDRINGKQDQQMGLSDDDQYLNSTFLSNLNLNLNSMGNMQNEQQQQQQQNTFLRHGSLLISGIALMNSPLGNINPLQLDLQSQKITSPNVILTTTRATSSSGTGTGYETITKDFSPNPYNIRISNQYIVNAAVGEGSLPEGALQFSKFMKLKSGWEKLGESLNSRAGTNDIQKEEWSNTQLYLRNMYQLGDDMKVMSKSLDKDKKKEAATLIDQYQKLLVKADKPANEKNLEGFMVVHNDVSKLLNAFIDLKSDVPDEL